MLWIRTVRALSVVLLLALCLPAGASDNIYPALLAEMDRSSESELHSVIVIMVEQAPIAQLNQELKERGATLKERHAEVLNALQAVRHTQAPLQAYLEDRIINGDVVGYTSYWISNMLVVQATKYEIFEIADRPDVDWIEPNFGVELIEPVGPIGTVDDELGLGRGIGVTPGLRAIRAPEVWYQLGFTGAGRLVANLDTGVDGNHPALNTRWRGYNGQHPWQECWLDLLGTGTQFPVDTYGHGTHVMGTETGLGAATEDTIGVSWGSQWIACNAINQGVSPEFDNDIITAYQWFADPDGDPGSVDDVPDVVQNSWRINENFPGDYIDCDPRWWEAIDNCEAMGVVTTWSAGNEGPGAQTIGSPPDRATTLVNTTSVGAVDATHYDWPYPIANWSSRGPTGCDVAPDHKFKPEVVAPGVDVYSSVPGGGYEQDGWSGTSMAGPHTAGIVGLMREANPNLDVDTIKSILLETARDEGSTGEDNTFGWGFVDAYEAVLSAMTGFGTIQGTVTNASWNNVPLPGAEVELEDSGYRYFTDETGYYEGFAAPGTYTATASMEGFEPQSAEVDIFAEEITTQHFSLTDNAGPNISDVTQLLATTDTEGPYRISATVQDFSTVQAVKLFYRLNGGDWVEMMMFPMPGGYRAAIPGQPTGTQIDYYVEAEDGLGLISTSPPNAPTDYYSTFITQILYDYTAEDPGDPNWTMGIPGDNASTGVWIRDDPVGTEEGGQEIQPEDDHTPDPGVKCFVTGNGSGDLGDNDVDDGCTTLLSPIFDLSESDFAFVTYYRWYGEGGASSDDTFVIDVSSDGGNNWVPLERVVDMENVWTEVTVSIGDFVTLTDQIQFKFQACDINTPGITEAAIDDFTIEVFPGDVSDVPEPRAFVPVTSLFQSRPNPARPITTIRFRLSNPSDASVVIYDAGGRKVRALFQGKLTAGVHEMPWDGRDDQGHRVGSGIYFYRLKAGAFEQSRRLTLIQR